MSKLTIGFSRPKNHSFPILSWVVRMFEGTNYSHSYIKWYSSTYDSWLVYHSAGFGLHFLGEREADRRLDIVKEYEIEVSSEAKKEMVKYCIQQAGTPYGLKTVLGIALVRLLNLKSNPLNDGSKTQLCSEAVALILSNHFDVGLYKPAEEFGVRDLEELMQKLTQG